jgi:hypothetical protein
MEGIPIPIVTKPYLAALKLRSSGYKDAGDIVNLMSLMNEDEKEKTIELAKQIGRDKKLNRILFPPEEGPIENAKEELI